ncbi:hypothetical protein [Hyphomicrobium denitrificans]|nr:hypothetical protein [Hyphomicrobium denitrificans]
MPESAAPNAFDVQPHLEAFARTISREPLGLAVHRPEAWATPTRCFENAVCQAEQKGGRALFGWMFHYRVVEDIPGPGYLIAVHHAVWHTPTGQLVDVTPLHDNPKHRPISPGGDVLFLVDTNARPIAVGLTVGPRPSRFYALDADERLVAYVRKLQEAEDEACRNLYAGGR